MKAYWYYVTLIAIIIVAFVLRFGSPELTEFVYYLYDTTRTTMWNWVGVTVIIILAIAALYRFRK